MKPQVGTVQALFYNQTSNPLYEKPVLQITALSKFAYGDNQRVRYKANLSDGNYYMKGIFSTEMSNAIENNEIKLYSVVKIGKFTVRAKENCNYLYIVSVDDIRGYEHEMGHAVNIITGKQSLEPSSVVKREEEIQKENIKPKQAAIPVMPYTEPEKGVEKRQKMDSQDGEITEIKKIFPHKKTFKFKGRVVAKSEIRRFNTQKGEGRIFSFEIADKTGQIKCVCFNESVDAFYPVIENNKVYTISNVTVKPANKKYSSNNSDFEIHLEKHTEVVRVEDDDVPKYIFKFVKIVDMSSVGGVVDCLAVIKDVYPASKVVLKATGKESCKRDLQIIDETGNCRLTIWGARAEEEYEKDSVICIKGAKVGDYNGVNLSTISNTQITINLDIPESVELLAWYQEAGKDIVIEKPKKTPRRNFISEVKEQSLEYATIQASVVYMKEEGLYYEACPSENCNKKVSMEDNGVFRCEKCNYTFDKCNYRYMINLHVGDFTGQSWVTIFDGNGKGLLGVTAEELKEMGENNPEDVHNLIKGIYSKEFLFRIKNKEENYNGDLKIRSSCLDISPVDYVFETKRMLDLMEKIVL